MNITIPALARLLALGGAWSSTDAQSPASVWDGAYTQDQAERGEALYRQQCATCHGDTLEGDGQTERAQKCPRTTSERSR